MMQVMMYAIAQLLLGIIISIS